MILTASFDSNEIIFTNKYLVSIKKEPVYDTREKYGSLVEVGGKTQLSCLVAISFKIIAGPRVDESSIK